MTRRSDALGVSSIEATTDQPSPPVSVGVGVVPDWIKRIADVERTRDAERDRVAALAARRADLVRAHGARVVRELLDAVRRDLAAFESEFAPGHSRHVELAVSDNGEGFVLRKETAPLVTLTVLPHLETATMACVYAFAPPNGLPPREDRVELVLVADQAEVLTVKHHKSGQTFTTADALSEFLLVPVLTGRPR